jgi:hypothetical protein
MAGKPGRTHERLVWERRLELLEAHRESLRAAGYDPDYIGVTEVEPLCCPGCGKKLPWAFLNRFR